MKKSIPNALVFCVFLTLLPWSTTLAQGNFTSKATGNWNSTTTWNLVSGTDVDGIPDSNDNVIIATGNTVSLNNALPSALVPACANLTLNGSGVVDYPTTLVVLTVNGALLMDGTSQFTDTGGGTVTLNATTTFGVASTATNARISSIVVNVTGITTVAGTLTFTSNTGAKTFSDAVTVTATGSWTSTALTALGNVIFQKGLSNSGTFNAGYGLFNTNAQAIGGTNALNFATGVTVNTIVVTNNNTVNIAATGTGVLAGSGTFTQGNNSTLNYAGQTLTVTNFNAANTGNTVNYTGTTGTTTIRAIATYYNLSYSGTVTGNIGVSTAVLGNLSTSNSGILNVNGAFTITVSGNLSMDGSSQITSAANTAIINVAGNFSVPVTATNTIMTAPTVTITGTSSISGVFSITSNTASKTFAGTITVASTGSWTTTAVTTNGNLIFKGGITNNGGTFKAGAADFTTSSQILAGTADISFANFVNVTGAAVTVTNNNTHSVSFTRVPGGGSTLSGTGGWIQGASSVLNYTGDNISITSFTATASGNTVNYDGAAQAILATSYYHLTYSGSSSPTATTASIGGDLTINSGTFAPTGLITFNNNTSSAQNIGGGGTFTFAGVTLNTATTNVNVNKSISISGALTFSTNRILVVGASANITLGSAATITSTPGFSSTCYIQLDGSTSTTSCLIVTAGTWNKTYPIGTSTDNYTPVTIATVTNAPTGGSLLSVKAIYNNSDQGEMRRVFRFIVSGNAVANTFFTTGTFDYNNATDISTGDAESNYTTAWYLAASSASAAWTNIATIAPPTNQFVVAGGGTATAALTNGTFYYTIGSTTAYPNTWYSYQTGVWSNWQNWTTDPSGSSLINGLNLPPQPGDAIVILNGITITNDVAGQVATTTTINAGATLDMVATTGNTLGTVSGSGLLRINGVNLPTGTYTSFVAATGGTIEYYNTGGNLPVAPLLTTTVTYNNLKLSNSTGTNITYISANNPNTMAINGTLTIAGTGTGTVTWQINGNGASYNVSQTIAIAGDVTVNSKGVIVVGTGNAASTTPHSVTLSGNLTNNGVVQFVDPNTAPFTSAITSTTVTNAAVHGNAATVTFSGVNDNTVTCNGQTDFYRFVVNKGNGTQAILLVNSSSTANFRLFGPANLGSSGQNSTDYSLTALSLINGTLELTGLINIPTLIEDDTSIGATSTDNYSLPISAELWLNGAGVSVTVTSNNNGNDDQRFNLEGVLLISAGTFSTGTSKGLNSGTAGAVIVQGGILNMCQFRPRAGSASQAFSFSQSGGIVNCGTNATGTNGTVATNTSLSNTGYGIFSIPASSSTFQMTGGVLNIGQPTSNAPGGIEITSSPTNYSVTGGTVNAYIPSTGNNFTISSTAPLFNLDVYREGTGAALNAQLQGALIVVNNFATITGNTPSFLTNNNALTVGGNFTIQANTTFTTATTTVTFNGSGAQALTNNGTISALTNTTIVVAKSAGTLTLGGTTSPVLPANLHALTLTSGTLADGGSTVTVTTILTNNAAHSGTGSITYTGTGNILGNNGTFGNLIITTANASVATAGNQTVTGNLQLNGATKSILNIASNSLTVDGNITTSQNGGVLSVNWCIQTSGLHNAGGLTRPCVIGTALTFPVGSNNLYTPNTITVNTATTAGTITVRPVNSEHPNVTTTNESLKYYWRVTSSGFVGLGTTNGSVVHANYIFSTATKGNSTANYVAARYDRTANTWGQCAQTNTMPTTILPNPFNTGSTTATWSGVSGDKLDGEYTCGNGTTSGNNAFGAVVTYYSRASGNWNDATAGTGVWSIVSNTGAACACNPIACPTCPVIIGDGGSNNHTVMTVANSSCGTLALNLGSTLDCSTFTGHNFGTATGGAVTGTGTLRIASGTFPSGDFTNFIGASGGTVEYYGTAYTIPSTSTTPQGPLSLVTYFNLKISPNTGVDITFPANNLTIYNDFTVSGVSATGRAVTNVTAARTINVNGNVKVNSGTWSLANNTAGTSTAITVTGNTTIGNAALFAVQTTNAATHTFQTTGSITNNGNLDFRGGASTRVCNITFTGSNNVNFTGNNTLGTDLAQVTVNKGTSQTPTVTFDLAAGTVTPVVTTTAVALGWLTLTNGTFDFKNGGTYFLSNSSYTIPSTAKLKAELGTVYITNTAGGANDLLLSGNLEVAGATVETTNGLGSDNDIEYASAGLPTITVSSGSLTVDGSVRRSITTLTGALVYNQSGGIVTVGGHASNNTRGVFEIDANTGSSFTMGAGASLIVQRTMNSTASYSDLFINPVSSNVSASSTISVGLNGAAQALSVNIAPAIGNFAVVGGTNAQTVSLYSNAMSVGGDLTITSPSSLVTRSLDVSIAGNLFITGTGSYIGGTAPNSLNTTTFNGTIAQSAQLSSGSSFNNVTVNNTGVGAAGTVLLSGTAPTLKNLNILDGILDVGALALNVNGDITNNSSQTASGNPTAGSITITTTTATSHTISSNNGSFTNLIIGGAAATNNLVTVTGNMTIDGAGTTIATPGFLSFSATNNVTRTLFIGSNQLTFTATATVGGNIGTTNGCSNFIKTNGVSSDQGVKKMWTTTCTNFLYPVGTRTNYTPVGIGINADGTAGTLLTISASSSGSFTVVPVDGPHPTANLGTGPSNGLILDYYWKVINTGLTIGNGGAGSIQFMTPTALVGGTGGTLTAAYLDLGASGSTSPTWGWQIGPNTTTSGTNTLGKFTNSLIGSYPTAQMPAASDEFDYSFGTSSTLPNPIAPVYSRFGTTSPTNTTSVGTTTTGGNWSLATNWTTSSTGYGPALSNVPTGVPVVILSGARINMDFSGQSAFTTQISGLLVISNSGESLGTITGTGTMRTTNSILPAGTYTVFTNTGGGTIEYATTMTMNSRTTYNNLLISSDYLTLLPSTVTMTASNLVINGSLTVSTGNTLDDSPSLAGQGGLALSGNFANSGTFISGANTVIGIAGNLANSGTFTAGSSAVTLTGNLQNTGTFDAGTGTVNLAGNLSNSGAFTSGTGTLTLNGTALQTITGSTTFNNLTINNSSAASPQVTIASGAQTVNSTLTMTDGNVNLNSTNFNLGASCASPGTLVHSLASSAGWMYGGTFTRYFTTTTIADGTVTGYFPVGNPTDYRPFFIGVPTGDMSSCGTFTVGAGSATNTVGVNIPDTNPTSTIQVQYQGSWTISSSGIVDGTFDLTAGGTGFGTIGNLTDLRLSKATSTVGTNVTAGGTTTDPQLYRTGLQLSDLTTTDGNQFFVSSTDGTATPLPIELLSFAGEAEKSDVLLTWATASETNNDYFTVLHSGTGTNFQPIGTVSGRGTTNSLHSYSLVDKKPIVGRNYYRLRQTDFDGRYKDTETIFVDVLSLEPSASVYPNPLKQNQALNVVVNGLPAGGSSELQIFNMQGVKLNGATVTTDADGTLRAAVAINGLSPGLYLLKVSDLHFKFVVE